MTTPTNVGQDRENAVKHSLADFPTSRMLKLIVGNCLLPFFRGRAEQVAAAPFGKPWNALDRLLRSGLYSEAFRKKDHRRLRAFLSNYWEEEAKNFHDGWKDRFERMFLKHDVEVIDALEEEMKGLAFERLYEIGCSGGQVLEYLAERLASLQRLTGIDLGEDQIAANRKQYDNSKMVFEAADATQWIPEHASSNSVFVTNGGVFEYFLQEELETLFKFFADQRKPAAVALVETIGTDHNLEREKVSLIYGREMSFSHNYPHLLEQAGFTIKHQSERVGFEVDGGGRWIRVLAMVQ
jgi:cyclopropane fatty-acyl-phospholipid synthase-like methyltransferase